MAPRLRRDLTPSSPSYTPLHRSWTLTERLGAVGGEEAQEVGQLDVGAMRGGEPLHLPAPLARLTDVGPRASDNIRRGGDLPRR
jgi:hypothetical protein